MTDPAPIDAPETEGPETDEEAAAQEAAAAEEAEEDEEQDGEQDEAEIDEVEPAILTLAGATRLIEAVLFASAQPVAEEDLAERLPEGTDLQAVLAEIATLYDGRGVNLVKIAGRWAFRTAPDLAPALQPEQTVQRKLSRAAVETLAIIAYHQPITRAEIEQVRGVALSKGTLDMLMEAGWIKPKGRRQAPGRPVTWVSTDDFLLHFGLDKIEDLPNLEELRSAGLLDKSMGIATLAMRQEEADAVNSAASKEHDEEDARIRQERLEASVEEAAAEERALDEAAAAKATMPAAAEAPPGEK